MSGEIIGHEFFYSKFIIHLSQNEKTILQNISLEKLGTQPITAIVGPNGSGKSTLLKCLAGINKVGKGQILFEGKNLCELNNRQLAKQICYMPQDSSSNAMLTVFESILLARKISNSTTRTTDQTDLKMVEHVLESLGISELSQSYISQISGGQQQLVAVAQAICRTPKILLLDEPTSALDLQRQLEILAILESLTTDYQMTCLVAIHDLNLASRFAKEVIVMNQGRLVRQGQVKEVFNENMLKEVYQIHAEISSAYGHTQIYPLHSTRDFLKLELN